MCSTMRYPTRLTTSLLSQDILPTTKLEREPIKTRDIFRALSLTPSSPSPAIHSIIIPAILLLIKIAPININNQP